jgi:hypothetical protein
LAVSCGREVLAAILRPGNAGANDADDHVHVLELALEQPPKAALDGAILARAVSAGASTRSPTRAVRPIRRRAADAV